MRLSDANKEKQLPSALCFKIMNTHLHTKRAARAARVRSKMHGTAKKPRVSVYRSNEHIAVQAIDDAAGKTLFGVDDRGTSAAKGTKMERSIAIAAELAKQLQKLKIDQVIFDRGYYKYHGRVKAIAETLREHGVKV